MKYLQYLMVAALAATVSAQAQQLNFRVKEGGVIIEGTSAGKVVLPAPKLLMSQEDYTGQKPTTKVEGDTLIASYENGAEFRMQASGSTITCEMSNVPADAKGFRFEMEVPLSNNKGGKYSFNGKSLVDIPVDLGEQFLQQGTANQFTLIGPNGDGLTVKTPESWQALQDNRKFNWAIYQYIFIYDFKKLGKKNFDFDFAPAKE